MIKMDKKLREIREKFCSFAHANKWRDLMKAINKYGVRVSSQ